MQGVNNVVGAIYPDYMKSKAHSSTLARRIENFWHRKGYKQVRAWVETSSLLNGEKYYSIRSNIHMKVPERD